MAPPALTTAVISCSAVSTVSAGLPNVGPTADASTDARMAMDAVKEALRIHHGANIDVPGRRARKEKKNDVVKELLALAFSR